MENTYPTEAGHFQKHLHWSSRRHHQPPFQCLWREADENLKTSDVNDGAPHQTSQLRNVDTLDSYQSIFLICIRINKDDYIEQTVTGFIISFSSHH